MYDKLERHNNRKVSYVINRKIEMVKNAILSFFKINKVPQTSILGKNYFLSTKK